MIAHDSRGTPEHARVLSAALSQRLRAAIDDRWRAPDGEQTDCANAALAAALTDAAAEARQRALNAEELILAIKALEREVAGARGDTDQSERRALRAWLVTTCIRAYFSAP
jgi:hypothetical protein